MARIARSSYLGKDPFGDVSDAGSVSALEPEQMALLRNLQDRCHTCARVHCNRILNKELKVNVTEMEDHSWRHFAADSTRGRATWAV